MTRVKHPQSLQAVSLREARKRRHGLTQLQLEALSGVDRTRISKLEKAEAPQLLHGTYEKLETALRKCGALKLTEKLVIGHGE